MHRKVTSYFNKFNLFRLKGVSLRVTKAQRLCVSIRLFFSLGTDYFRAIVVFNYLYFHRN